MSRRIMNIIAVAVLAALTFSIRAEAGTMRIIGGLSNFDCYNDTDSDTEGFEIELEGVHKEDVVHTWNGSAFGAPTVVDGGTTAAPTAIVRYRSSTAVLPHGGLTHFGVSLRNFRPSTAVYYRWLPKATLAIPNPPPVPLALPTHTSQVVYTNGIPFVQNVIHNNAPDGGPTLWVLPFAHLVPRPVALEELIDGDPVTQGGTPDGSGPGGLTPERLDPGNSWSNDDPSEENGEESMIYTYEVYEDVIDANGIHSPGRQLMHMMDASITASGPIGPNRLTLSDSSVYGTQSVTATLEINGMAPVGGLTVNLGSNNTHVTLPATVVVPENQYAVTFTIATSPVATLTSVNITASANGVGLSGSLSVKPPDLSTLYLAYRAQYGGVPVLGRVYLFTPAPTEGAVVTLSSNNVAASVPASVTVAAGATTADFTVTTHLVSATTAVTITSVRGTVTLTQPLTLNVLPKVSGKITLPQIVNGAQTLDFDFRPISGGTALHRSVTLAANGTFALTDIPLDNYTLAVKGAKWLRKTIAVNTSTGVDATANLTLPAGDANNDNSVDIADLLLLITHYNQSQGTGNFLDAADFNCDGVNDITDLLLLIGNYNQQGTP